MWKLFESNNEIVIELVVSYALNLHRNEKKINNCQISLSCFTTNFKKATYKNNK